MNQSDLIKKVEELFESTAIHAELLATITTQLADITAAVETALSTEREILSKLGMNKDEIRKRQDAARANALDVAHKSLESNLKLLGKLGPAVDPQRNKVSEN